MKKKCSNPYIDPKVGIKHAILLGSKKAVKDMSSAENLVLLNCGITKKILESFTYEELGVLYDIVADAMLEITTLRAESIG